MKIKQVTFFIFCVVFCLNASAKTSAQSFEVPIEGIKISPDTLFFSADLMVNDSLIKTTAADIHNKRKKKFVTALFAFPFPFGFVGAHRVMLGTKPWVPIVYVATFGGCFGIVPLIDFIVILSKKDIEEFENNSQVFMWLK